MACFTLKTNRVYGDQTIGTLKEDKGMLLSTSMVCPIMPTTLQIFMSSDGNFETSDGNYIMVKI